MTIQNPALDQWEAVYYTNPIPLSSRSLLAFALLFDRIHIPGVSITQHRLDPKERAAIRAEWDRPLSVGPEAVMMQASHRVGLWAIEQPSLGTFVHLPDIETKADIRRLDPAMLSLIDDTYGEGASAAAIGFSVADSVVVPGLPGFAAAFTWPLYQSRALEYAREMNLPLISDDLRFVPPLPEHPSRVWSAKTLAQQLAVQAVSLVLPEFQSVEPSWIPEFRDSVQGMARPFRTEMAKMTTELALAISQGVDDDELRALGVQIVQSKVLPAVQELSNKMREPLRPWYKTALEVTEAGLYAATSVATRSEFIAAWALFRGAKIASEYVKVYADRKGLQRSGLAYLIKIGEPQSDVQTSDWDKHDWLCSGSFDILDPGTPITPENLRYAEQLPGFSARVVRRVWQNATASFVQFVPPAKQQ